MTDRCEKCGHIFVWPSASDAIALGAQGLPLAERRMPRAPIVPGDDKHDDIDVEARVTAALVVRVQEVRKKIGPAKRAAVSEFAYIIGLFGWLIAYLVILPVPVGMQIALGAALAVVSFMAGELLAKHIDTAFMAERRLGTYENWTAFHLDVGPIRELDAALSCIKAPGLRDWVVLLVCATVSLFLLWEPLLTH